MGALSYLRDGLINVLSGRGTSVDRTTHTFWHHIPMPPEQIEAAYRSSWLISKIVDLVPMDMVREWREWEAKPEETKRIEEAEKRLKVQEAILTGLVYGRLGGGVVILGSGTDMAAPARKGDKLLYVKAVPAHRIGLGDMDWDVESENFGEPGWFTLNGARGSDRIHPSRIIAFKGERVPGISGINTEAAFWGDPVIERVDKAVKNALTATDGFASLIDEAKIDIYRIAGMADRLLEPDGETMMAKRFEATALGKSAYRAIFLDKEDEWETRELNWAGIPDIIKTYLAIVAGAADIPATRLLGKAPDGMNATGESDEKNYRASILTRQNMVLRPALDKLDALLLPTVGVAVDTPWAFCELDAPTEKEQAEIDKLEAETVQIYVNSGMVAEPALAKSVQARMIESGRWPNLKDELDKLPDMTVEKPDDPKEDPSALQAGKGGDPSSGRAGGGRVDPAPPARAANDWLTDATPRTLYVRRDIVNIEEIAAWARKQGLPPLQEGLHVTICHIDQPFDWMKIEGEWNQNDKGEITIQPGGVRILEPLGNRTAVMLFTSSPLSWRHEQIVRASGGQDKFEQYQPHFSLTGEPVDLTGKEPYRGKIVLGPEIFEEVRDNVYGSAEE